MNKGLKKEHTMHPITQKLGIDINMQPGSRLEYSAAPGTASPWHHANVYLSQDNALEFSVSDDARSFSASFNSDGKVTSINCSTGIPTGDTVKVLELFFEEARQAIQSLVLFH